MRVPWDQLIRNPEAYIVAVARQMVAEFMRCERRSRARVCVDSEQVERLVEQPGELCADEPARWVSSSQPPERAAALLLHERDGFSYAQVAQTLGVSERAVERYLMKARDGCALGPLLSESGRGQTLRGLPRPIPLGGRLLLLFLKNLEMALTIE